MGDSYVVEYNKDRMLQLKEEFEGKIRRYRELKEDLETNVNAIGDYWITSDTNSNDAYQNLKGKYAKYKASLDEGNDLMNQFAQQIDSQIQKYEEAEARINNALEDN